MAKQRIIAITGASGGLAQEIVKQLSPSDGIILLGRDKDKLEKCYRHVENKTCLAIDLRDDNAIKEMVDYLYQRFGRIDVFINNAGFGEFKSYDNYTSQEVRDMFDINTFATMTFSRLMAEKMVEQGHGHIVNIASIAGKIATANSSVYAATKFAVIGFSDALRLELADKGVYVTT
ncbi:MAG: SDR family NAD(P)-dependent oxidoreductase, partial [Streptococcus vestibularis]|nr:SDR family NAD(P)-dependent oxidoreductase [Streptococcus vestibularis]